MQVTRLDIEGLMVLEPHVFADERGAFFESFNLARFREATGIDVDFVQDNHSISHKNVLRGVHYQAAPHAQGKLVRVVRGAAWDVAVDLRAGSPTCGKWAAVELTATNRKQFWIPQGFAHGFLALEDGTEILYKTTAYWHGASERTIRWDDPAIGVIWPTSEAPVVSAKDAAAGVPLMSAFGLNKLNTARSLTRRQCVPSANATVAPPISSDTKTRAPGTPAEGSADFKCDFNTSTRSG